MNKLYLTVRADLEKICHANTLMRQLNNKLKIEFEMCIFPTWII